MFPRRDGVNYLNLKNTEEGSYSVTKYRDSEQFIKIIREVMPNLTSITDMTGCVGGDTINFALHFQRVRSIEINKENYNALCHNISVYGLQNVETFLGDSLKLYDWNSDAIYIDPPWGGPAYRAQKVLDLFISNKRLDIWLIEILNRNNRPAFIFIKLPYNYNFERFDTLPNVEYIKTYKIRNLIFLILKTNLFSLEG
jgi:hypothetical protein